MHKNTLAEYPQYSRPFDFPKESKSQASYFPINSVLHLSTNLLCKENGSSLFHGKIFLFRIVQYKTFNGAETNCGIAHILGILLMNSCNTDIFFRNYYHLQSVRFELIVDKDCGPWTGTTLSAH